MPSADCELEPTGKKLLAQIRARSSMVVDCVASRDAAPARSADDRGASAVSVADAVLARLGVGLGPRRSVGRFRAKTATSPAVSPGPVVV
eukprot:scaffold2261_cov231-Pinguiococcus_pyrenoidosus.AAC.7